MAQNKHRMETIMGEKLYKVMGHSGGVSIALGVVSIVAGLTIGILSIVLGGKLLKNKSDIMF